MGNICFIWDAKIPQLIWGEQQHIIDSQDKFDVFDFSEIELIYVLAELNWANKNRSDFYGIKLVQTLRLRNINSPIIVCSFLPRNTLIEEYKFDILRFRAHSFIQLPDNKPLDNNDLVLLSEMAMEDVKFHFCGLSGAITSIYHRKQNAGNKIEGAKKFLTIMMEEIKNLPDLPESVKSIVDIDIKVISEIKDKKSLESYMALPVTHITSHLESVAGISDSQILPTVMPEGKWGVLILDDEPKSAIVNSIFHSLSKASIKVHLVPTVEMAQKLIEEDIYNQITVVISDYRIENEREIKGDQGYDFIQWLAIKPRFNSIFVLSGLDRYFVKKIFKSYGIKVHSENKNELLSSRFSEYITEIIEAGNEEYNCILNRPNSGDWNPHIRTYYAHYRSLPDHDNIEREVSKRAKRIKNELDVFFTLRGRQDWFHKFLSDGPVITKASEITSKLWNEITKDTIPVCEKTWRAFIEVMVYRRVALYIIKKYGIDRLFVSGLIHRGKFMSEPSKGQVFTRLGISMGDFPNYCLVEELNWFKAFTTLDPEQNTIGQQESFVFIECIVESIENIINIDYEKSIQQIERIKANEGNPLFPCFINVKDESNEQDEIVSEKLVGKSKYSKKQKLKIHCSTTEQLSSIVEDVQKWDLSKKNTEDFQLIKKKMDELIKLGIL